MALYILFIISSLLQMGCGQQPPQLLMQYLNPSQAAALSAQPGQAAGTGLGVLGGPAASLGQILMNLLNYKLQWLNQVASHLTGTQPAPDHAKPGALHIGHPPGYPFMTTLVTTLSGNSPAVPGITITGSPINHLAYPGAPTTAPPQDFHWIPVIGPGAPALVPVPQSPAVSAPVAALAPQAPAHTPLAPQTPAAVPVIPAVDDFLPISTQSPTTTTTTTTTTPKSKNVY